MQMIKRFFQSSENCSVSEPLRHARVDISRYYRALSSILVGTLCLSLSCWPVRSASAVYGVYELWSGAQHINLEIRPDGKFKERIVYSSEKVEEREGKWFWRADSLNAEKLWIPKAFAPDYILKADANSGGGDKYTEPGNWSLHVEKQFGTTTLIVFPDADINFRMIKHIH